jgi:microcystin-dependent protein
MATLSFTHTFIAGTLAKSSEVNQNFTDIVNWSAGNIANDNLDTMTGTIDWSVTTGVKAISIANSGNEGSIGITQSAVLNPNKSDLSIIDNAAQISGVAALYCSMSSLSATIPVARFDYAGDQVVTVNKHRLELPIRTTTQRDSISPANGSILYVQNSPVDRHTGLQVKEANGWSHMMPPGVMLPYAGANVPSGWLECIGQEVSQTTYAALFSAIGSTWNTGGEAVGNFRLPDMRRRTAIGKGGTAVAGPANTLGSTGGHEQMQAHSHTASSDTVGNHTHNGNTSNAGLVVSLDLGTPAITVAAGSSSLVGASGSFGSGNDFTSGVTGSHYHSFTTDPAGSHSHSVTVNSSGSGNAENMQPSAVVTYIIKF